MRSAVLLLIFAVSIVAWECAGDDALLTEEQRNVNAQPDGTGITTTTAQQAPAPKQILAKVPEPVPEPAPAPVSEEVSEEVEVPPEEPHARGIAEGTDVGEIKTVTDAPPKPELEHEKSPVGHQDHQQQQQQQQPQQQQLQQQQQHSRNSEPDRTKVGVQTEMRTVGDIQLAPNTPPSSTGGHVTHTSQDKTPNTPGNPPKPPTDSQASQSSTSGRNVNTQTPTTTIIRQTASHPPEQDQHHARQQPQTSPPGNNPVPTKKPTPTSTKTPNNAVIPTNITTREKETNPTQAAVSSTPQPVKETSAPLAKTLEKLSTALQSLEKTDNSFASFSLYVLAALATVFFVALAPPS